MKNILDLVSRVKAVKVAVSNIERERNALVEQSAKADFLAVTERKSQVLIQEAAKTLQNNIKSALTTLCTKALKDVFPDKDISFNVNFVPHKHTTAIEMSIQEDGIDYDPLESRGHGLADVLTFALRVSILALQPNLRRILIMDEPFTRVSEEYRDRVIEFVKEVSKQTGIQIILVTHIPELAENANKVFTVTKRNDISYIE